MIDKENPTWKQVQKGLSAVKDMCVRAREENQRLYRQMDGIRSHYENTFERMKAENLALRDELKPCLGCVSLRAEIERLNARVVELEELTVSLTTQIVDLNASKEVE